MRRHKIWRWLADQLTDFALAALKGDTRKIVILIIIIVCVLVIVWLQRVFFRREAVRRGWPLDGSVPEDKWVPPPSKDVDNIVNQKPASE